MSKQKLIAPPPSIDLLIHSLKHHAPENSDPYSVCKNPFEEINAVEELAKSQKILDYDSEPDSEVEDALYDTQWGDADQEYADTPSIDPDTESMEVVERAGVYTAEEVLKLSIEKATKLHSLYSSQLNQLRQIYIDKKRQYLQDLKKEKELYCSIHNQKKTSLEEMKKYKQLKASIAYGRKRRLDTILAKREHEKRVASTSKTPSKAKTYKCNFQDDGVRCFATCIPLTKYCIRHILMDKRQVLFRACGAPYNNTTCNNPVLVTVPDDHCVFHTTYQSVLDRERPEQSPIDDTKHDDIKEEIEPDVDIEDTKPTSDTLSGNVMKEEEINTTLAHDSSVVEDVKVDVEEKSDLEALKDSVGDLLDVEKSEETRDELRKEELQEETVKEETVEEETVQVDVDDHIVHID